MRGLILLGLISLVATDATAAQRRPLKTVAKKVPAPVAPLPVFSFLGDDTATVTTRTVLNAQACTSQGEVKSCSDYSYPEIGGAKLKWLSIGYNRGLLYQVFAETWSNRYATLLEAFTIKYGTPKMEVRKWQSKAGATFDNAVATWQFKDGELELDSMGSKVDTSSFMFVSTANSPPRDKPKIDF